MRRGREGRHRGSGVEEPEEAPVIAQYRPLRTATLRPPGCYSASSASVSRRTLADASHGFAVSGALTGSLSAGPHHEFIFLLARVSWLRMWAARQGGSGSVGRKEIRCQQFV